MSLAFLEALLGRERVAQLEAHIRAEAQKGAEAAIPKIRQEVRAEASSTVRPFVIGGLIVSGLALAASAYTLFYTRRSTPALRGASKRR